MTTPNTLFESAEPSADGDERWIATALSRGPWNPLHCHGGPTAALLARACEQFDDGLSVDWHISRMTIELVRPVPVGVPLTVDTELERPGGKVSLLAAQIRADDTVVARARVLRIRQAELELPEEVTVASEFEGGPADAQPITSDWAADAEDGVAFHLTAMEFRVEAGGWYDPGPSRVWLRLASDVVPEERPSGLQRVVAAADFGNGMSGPFRNGELTYINPDLTVYVGRAPDGEWIGLACHSVYGTGTQSNGTGYAESALHDERGRIGRSVQALILQQP